MFKTELFSEDKGIMNLAQSYIMLAQIGDGYGTTTKTFFRKKKKEGQRF